MAKKSARNITVTLEELDEFCLSNECRAYFSEPTTNALGLKVMINGERRLMWLDRNYYNAVRLHDRMDRLNVEQNNA